jgi:hypothetical protein
VWLVGEQEVGFGQASAFGGPARMPALDNLAAEGLRYNGFHTIFTLLTDADGGAHRP